MSPPRPVLAWKDVSPKTRKRIASWLASRVDDLEIDAEQLAEEQGADYLPGLRGLVEMAGMPDDDPTSH